MKQVVLSITKDGTTTISVNGVCGPECKELTRAVEDALGTVESIEPTPEMYTETTDLQEVNQ